MIRAMSWFVYAVICALGVATMDVLSKKALNDHDSYFVAWVRAGFAAPLLLFALPFIEIPKLDNIFFIITSILLPLDIIAMLLYVRAISISPLSLTLPFLSLTPVFAIGTSYIILGEKPDRTGFVGIVLVVIGAYLLNVHTIKRGLLEPLKAIVKEKGSVLMVIVSFIVSTNLSFGKIVVRHSSPMFFSIFYMFMLSIFLFVIVRFKTKNVCSKIFSQPLLFLFIGISMAVATVTHLKAISLVEVSYMASVKRLNILFGVAFGALFFVETNIKERFLGAAIMVFGIFLISI
jgi:drug/metabolite transporter (DMT)-like permease